MKTARLLSLAALAAAAALAGCSTTASVTKPDEGGGPSTAESRHAVDASYQETLDRLYASTPGSRELVAKARGVLVFPRVISAGLVVGGAYGEGQLREHGRVEGYYRTTTGSVGWQIGAQSRAHRHPVHDRGLAAALPGQQRLVGRRRRLRRGADRRRQRRASTPTPRRPPRSAFIMTNAGLMAGATLQGTKITRIAD